MTLPGFLSRLADLNVEQIIYVGVKFELYMIVVACVLAICIMSLAAAIFIVATAIHHAFPNLLIG